MVGVCIRPCTGKVQSPEAKGQEQSIRKPETAGVVNVKGRAGNGPLSLPDHLEPKESELGFWLCESGRAGKEH